MSAGPRLPALLASLILLCSCSGPATSRSVPVTSPTSPASTAASPTLPGRPSDATPPALNPLVVHIRSFAYLPAAPTVIVGQPIEIINDDLAAHTWSAAPGAGWAYTSGNLEKGQRATFPGFPKAGSYRFLCYYHAEMPSMIGVVRVSAAP